MPRLPSLAVLPILALPALSACGDGGSATRLDAVVDSVDGVPLLTFSDRQAPKLDWRLDTLFVLGGYEQEEDAYQFDQVGPGSLAGTEDGALFVLDGTGSRVLGYDEHGTPIGAWGRQGGGPGELQGPGGLGIGPGDSLWVADRGNRRVTIFPPDTAGTPSDLPLGEASSGLGGALEIDASGLYAVVVMFSFRPGEEVSVPPQRLLHVTRAGEVADTLWTAPPREFDQVELTSGGARMMMMMQREFTPALWWDRFADGSFAVADGADYEVAIVAPDGTVERRIRREPPARATTEADREGARRRARERAEASTSDAMRQSVEQRIGKMTFAPTIPRITGLAVDTKDRLWVGVSTEVPGETGRIDVYGREGALVGEIRDPELFPALFFGDGRAAVLDRDELDVQRVIVLALREGGTG
ncbi:MAG: hypothetical protein R6X22_11855 [Gemmatimonadota bacterium]|jgi:hypothetical protein